MDELEMGLRAYCYTCGDHEELHTEDKDCKFSAMWEHREMLEAGIAPKEQQENYAHLREHGIKFLLENYDEWKSSQEECSVEKQRSCADDSVDV